MNENKHTSLFGRDSWFYYMEDGEIKRMLIEKHDVNDKYYRYKKKWNNRIIHNLNSDGTEKIS